MLPVVLGLAAAGLGTYLYLSSDSKPQERIPQPEIPPMHPTVASGSPISVPGQSTTLNGTTFTVVAPPPGPPVVTGGPLITQGLTPGGVAIFGLHNLNDLGSDFASAAIQLSDYLHASGLDNSPRMQALTANFQSQAKRKNIGYSDAMTQPGVYDLATSAALTVAIGAPIPPDTQGKQFASYPFSVTSNPTGSNAASASATNLWSYLRSHSNDHSPMLAILTKQFQHDVNTDPRYPGPAALGIAKSAQKFKTKIKEDGLIGTTTTNALKVYGMA